MSQSHTKLYLPEQYLKWAEDLIRMMGPDWVEAHQARPYRAMHPIASWIQGYSSSPDHMGNPQSLLQIGELMGNIEVLRHSRTDELDTRVEELKSDNFERVASSIHEIRVAARFADLGHQVQFIPETTVKTPDLLINESLEIECKHKMEASAKDKARFELYSIFLRRLRALFHARIKHESVSVRINFHVEPTRKHIDQILVTCRQALRTPLDIRLNDDIPAEYSMELATNLRDENSGRLLIHDNDKGKYDQIASEAVVIDPLGPRLGRSIYACFKCDIRQDRVKSILNSLKSALSQFSGDKPAIVYIDVSNIRNAKEPEFLPHLKEDIEAILKNNSTVSEVRLETTRFYNINGQEEYGTSTETIKNSSARFPIDIAV